MCNSIYVVLSQTGTIFSRALKILTKAEYNHVSLSLSPTLDKMYSFGRLNPSNPFIGGFVVEGKDIGTFKKFYNTQAMVIQIKVDQEKYNAIKYFIDYFIEHNLQFHYNYLGVLLACFNKDYSPNNRYYCSQFVRTCLASFDIENARELPKVIKPIDFLKLKNKNIIYVGLLREYILEKNLPIR